MKWEIVTNQNYHEKLCKRPHDRMLWERFCEEGYSELNISQSFEMAYKIRPFVLNRRVLDFCSGTGLLSILLLSKKWIKSAILIENTLKVEQSQKIQAFLTKWNIKSILFICGNVYDIKLMRSLCNYQFDVIMAMRTCDNLSLMAVQFSLSLNKNIVIIPCCTSYITDRIHRNFLSCPSNASGYTASYICGLMASNNYHVRVRVGKGLTTFNRSSLIVIATKMNPKKKHTKRSANIVHDVPRKIRETEWISLKQWEEEKMEKHESKHKLIFGN